MITTANNQLPPAPPDSVAANRPGQEPPVTSARPAGRLPPVPAVRTLTGSQLHTYRRELEHALKTLPAHAPVRVLLAQHLAAVRAEQQTRAPAPQAAGQAR